jgi:hypothetical protein
MITTWVDRADPLATESSTHVAITRRDLLRRAAVCGLGAAGGSGLLYAGASAARAADAPAADAGFAGRAAFADLDTKALIKAIRKGTFGQANIDATIEALARAGVGVYAAPGDAQPIAPVDGEHSPVRVVAWQARNLALELNARGGQIGSDLDGLVDAGTDAIAPSHVLAAYATAGSTPGAALARALIGKPDPSEAAAAVYPMVVPLLVVADLTRGSVQSQTFRLALEPSAHGSGSGAAEGQGRQVLADPPPLYSWCFDLKDFINTTVWQALIALSKADEGTPARQLAEEIRDYLHGKTTGSDADKQVKDVIASIHKAAQLLAIASQMISLLKPWAVRVDADPPATRFGVGDEVVQGQIRVRVDFGGLEAWPEDLGLCASDAGYFLPALTAKDEYVGWDLIQRPDKLISTFHSELKLDGDGQVVMAYATNQESPEVAAGQERKGRLTVNAFVELSSIHDSVDFLFSRVNDLLNALPAEALDGIADDLYERLYVLLKSTGQRNVTIIYHVKEKQGKTKATVNNTEADPELVGIWEVTDLSSLVQALLNTDDAPMQMYSQGQTGSLTYNFGKDGSLGVEAGEFAASTGADNEFGHLDATIFVEGGLAGSYSTNGSDLTLNFGGAGDLSARISVVAGGTEVVNRPVDNLGLLFPNATISYEVGKDELRLYTSPEISIPIVLTRIG